jgi:hypothetical protein
LAPTLITLKKYYSSFKSLSGVLAGLFAGLPYLSQFLPGSAYTFPPLGDGEPTARVGLVVLAFATTFGVYFWGSSLYRRTGRMIAAALAICLTCLLIYFVLYERFVRRIDIPSREAAVYVSIGYERTAFAISAFGSAPDEELLRARGTDEEQLRLLWTTKSLIAVRLVLYAAYCGIVLALVAAFSFGVAGEVYRQSL